MANVAAFQHRYGPRGEGTDVKVIAWLTDQTPGDFAVAYAVVGGTPKTAVPSSLDGVEFDRVRITEGRQRATAGGARIAFSTATMKPSA